MTKKELIEIKLLKAQKTFDSAKSLKNGDWNTISNRLYYTVFYLATALLVDLDIDYKSHSGVKNAFLQHFIKTQILDLKYSELYTNLFFLRQMGDYDDIIFTEETVSPYIEQVEEFLNEIFKFLNPSV